MGRRRWRVVTIAAFLLCVIKETQCQDDEYYYTPVERNFAQVQPPLYSNNRQAPDFFENGESPRVAQPPQQPIFNDGNIRFPSPNYNQNPSPFQLPTGRSQSGAQYYVNQPEYTSQRQRFRPAPPFNYQLVHPASTRRPDTSQIHSVAYQNDPSKPETFLGQITLNNPDVDYLQNSRFKNTPFDTNSLKSNGQSGHIIHDGDSIDNQDIFDQHRVTTYNPNKLIMKQRLNIRPSASQFPYINRDEKVDFKEPSSKIYIKEQIIDPKKVASEKGSTTEYKALLDIEPLLEDDISDITSFRELMKNKKGSFDVQVIKSNITEVESTEDSKPDASSMNTDNFLKEIPVVTVTTLPTPTTAATNLTSGTGNGDDDEEYVDYEYEDTDSQEEHTSTTTNPKPTTKVPTTQIPSTKYHVMKEKDEDEDEGEEDVYDEYDSTEIYAKTTHKPTNTTESFDILVTKPGNTTKTVQDDNFKQFVDTTVIDQVDKTDESDTTDQSNQSTESSVEEHITSIETPSILGQEVVSVVTTKSVVNGTISIPDVTISPSTAKMNTEKVDETSESEGDADDGSIPVTTENWVVVASVQTSRSVSGARFLPFPTVEQEEKKQVLTDEKENLDDYDESVTIDPRPEINNSSNASTENINDKLDSIQSELSSAVLSGSLDKENKNIELITESSTEQSTTSSTTPALPNVFTLKSTLPPSFTERSSPDPLPVQIKKFTPRVTSSTTPKPRKKPSLVTVMDDLSGLLPPGYKQRLSYKDKRTSTTTTTTTTTTAPQIIKEVPIINETQGRSSGISSKNKVIVLDDKSLLPREYKPKEHKPQDDLFKRLQKDDLGKLLPPGYKPPATQATESKNDSKPSIIDKIEQVDITAFLPKDFKLPPSSTTEKTKELKLPGNAVPVDIAAFLPPGFKLNSTDEDSGKNVLNKIKVINDASLLPPGFNPNATETVSQESSSTTTKAPGGIKLVFPSRPGGKVNRKTTTPKPMGPSPVTPKIQKGWPTRASTEFTGWPSPSTTPFSIEKLLEAQRNATATSPLPEISTEMTTKKITTTTTTTPAPPPSTTPGVCKNDCDIAGTIKLVSGVKWVPELLDHHTDEWQRLAHDVKEELNSVYLNSASLRKWYKGIRIDGFSKGSVLVDYFIELNDVEQKIDTVELKKLFHKSLHKAKTGSVVETVEVETKGFDPDAMLGDQPEEDRMKKSNEKMTKTIDMSAGKLEIGKFVMDPAYTEFIVLPKREEPKMVVPEEESFLPQWGIAVIVIALASLLFVVIFGVTVLVNRQKSAKAKQPIPLSEEMLRDLDKSHMGGFDDLHHSKDRDLPYLPPGKRMSTAFIEQLSYPNQGDSWRSEWTPQLQKYMQHYTPDSGRGSQTYGGAYGYNAGSQMYGQSGGGSQLFGYTGEYPRSHYSRRRSEYDSNF